MGRAPPWTPPLESGYERRRREHDRERTAARDLRRPRGGRPPPRGAGSDARLQAGQGGVGTPRRHRLQALLQREPLRAAALGARRHRRRRDDDQPLSRHGRDGTDPATRTGPRRAEGVHRHRHRVGRRARADHQCRLRRGRRGDLRVALLRGLSHRHPAGRCIARHGRARRAGPAPPGRDVRRDHRPHPRHPRVHAQQPHRSRRPPGRARGLPRQGAERRHRRHRRGLRGVRPGPRRGAWPRRLAPPPQRRRAAHLLQGLRPRRPPGGVCRRAPSRRRSPAQDGHALRCQLDRPGGGDRLARRRRRADGARRRRSSPSASGSCRRSPTRAGSCPGPMRTSCGSRSVPTRPPSPRRARRQVSWCGSTATTACG